MYVDGVVVIRGVGVQTFLLCDRAGEARGPRGPGILTLQEVRDATLPVLTIHRPAGQGQARVVKVVAIGVK